MPLSDWTFNRAAAQFERADPTGTTAAIIVPLELVAEELLHSHTEDHPKGYSVSLDGDGEAIGTLMTSTPPTPTPAPEPPAETPPAAATDDVRAAADAGAPGIDAPPATT